MSDFSVYYNKATGAKEGYLLATEFLQSSQAKSMFPVSIDFSFSNGDRPRITGRGKGFEVTLLFNDQEVRVDLDLKFLLKPMKGKIIDTLTQEIKRVL